MSDIDWDEYAKDMPHDHLAYQEKPQMERVQKVIERIGEPCKSVLDIGSSDGYPAFLYAKAGHKVHCVDVSQRRIDRVKDKYNLDGTVSDGKTLPFEDESYEVAVLAEVLEHVDNPGALFAEAVRVVGPLGKVIVTVPLNGWADPTHIWGISIDVLGIMDPNEPTKGQQAVMTWRGGRCWPQHYYEGNEPWRQAHIEGIG